VYNSNWVWISNLVKQWNNLSYDEQQAKLAGNADLKKAIQYYWLIEKKPEQQNTVNNTKTETSTNQGNQGNEQTVQQAEWDYQDNSQARMDQIANNLRNYSKTNPDIFESRETFKNFFIDWKGRSKEQVEYLKHYYDNYKEYNKYDNLTSEQIGDMLVNWKIPSWYLDWVKANDPAKALWIANAMSDSQEKISNESYLQSLVESSWEDTGINSDLKKYAVDNWLLVDKNKDWVDDRLYVEPTQEELTKQNRINEIDSRLMEIQKLKSNMLEELTNSYPWVSKSTLMWIVQDRMWDLQKEYDNLQIERAGLAWSVQYLQNERTMQTEAGQQTINNLQKAYWMYYQYSPEWIKERTQAEYEATHITLDQADNWTDTEKQMALDSYLTGYFDKYWDIIERSKEEVIQDAMNYAKKNWVSLSKAVEDTFTNYLKEKPWFKQLNTVGNWSYKWAKIWQDEDGNDIYWFVDETNWTVNPYGNVSLWGGTGYDYDTWWTAGSEWSNGNQVILDWDPKTDTWIPNVYGNTVKLKSEVWDKLKQAYDKLKNEYGITLAIWDSYVSPEYKDKMVAEGKAGNVSWSKSFHSKGQAFDLDQWVESNKSDIVSQVLLDAGFTRAADWERWHWSYWEWPDTFGWTKTVEYGYGEHPMYNTYMNLAWNKSLNADQKSDLKFANQLYGVMYRLASSWDIDHLLRSWDWQKILANLKNSKFIQEWKDVSGTILFDALKNNLSDQRNIQTVNDLITAIELKLRKTSWAAIAASEWSSNFDMLLPGVWEDYSVAKHKYENFEQEYLKPYFDYVGAGNKKYKWYDPIFSENSKYYKLDKFEPQYSWNWWRFNTPTYFQQSNWGVNQDIINYGWKILSWKDIRYYNWAN
jgi:hypothetical protein